MSSKISSWLSKEIPLTWSLYKSSAWNWVNTKASGGFGFTFVAELFIRLVSGHANICWFVKTLSGSDFGSTYKSTNQLSFEFRKIQVQILKFTWNNFLKFHIPERTKFLFQLAIQKSSGKLLEQDNKTASWSMAKNFPTDKNVLIAKK